MSDSWCPVERWEPHYLDMPDVVRGGGPDSYFCSDPPETMPMSRPVGFTVRPRHRKEGPPSTPDQ